MCGRFGMFLPAKTIAEFFFMDSFEEVQPRYNIAPTQEVLAILMIPSQNPGKAPQTKYLRWGLIPAWAKDSKISHKLCNARSETVRDKPSFRAAFKCRRCLIPASGFYEWKSEGKVKQPHYITSKNGDPLALAGLWEHWSSPDAEVSTCTILTTNANDLMRPIHHRMPVILDRDQFQNWLDPNMQDTHQLQHLLAPCPNSYLIERKVSRFVSKSQNEGARCLEPPEAPLERQLTLF